MKDSLKDLLKLLFWILVLSIGMILYMKFFEFIGS